MPTETEPERICSLDIDMGQLATWTAVSKGAVKKILERSPGGLQFFPSECVRLAAGARQGLPGYNDLTGLDVSKKFQDRIMAFAPAAVVALPEPAFTPEPEDDDDGAGDDGAGDDADE